MLTHYSKNFLVILLAITVAITLIDYLQYSDKLTGSVNQSIMYAYYTWSYGVSQFYPLAIVFAAVVTYMSLVNSNTIVSLLSFGYTKLKLFIPYVLPAILFYMFMIYLQLGEFAYAQERAKDILNKKDSSYLVDDMLFKYNDNFVYVGRLNPVKKILSDVILFGIDRGEVAKITSIQTAKYNPPFWVCENAIITEKRYNKRGELSGFTRENIKNYKFLKDYKPKVIELIYEGESLSIRDAYNAYGLLKEQNLNASKVKASLYNKVITPLFAFAMVILIFFKTSYYARYMNKELVWAISLGGTLVVWGIFYALFNVAKTGAISVELSMLLPVSLFLLYALYVLLGADKKLV